VYEGIVQELIDELGRLPGIGPKSAQRIAFHILQTESFDTTRLAQILTEVRDKVRFCEICGNVSEQATCSICAPAARTDRGSRKRMASGLTAQPAAGSASWPMSLTALRPLFWQSTAM